MSESRPHARWAPAWVFAAAALVYVNTLPGEFVYDDFPFIVSNPAVHTLERPWKFLLERSAFSEEGFYTIFRPLPGWLFSLTWAGAGPTPGAFHAVNLLAHALAAVCVWRFVRALGLQPAQGALLAGLVFAVHPVQTEAVAWISGLGNPLHVIGLTGAGLAWLRWRRQPRGTRSAVAVVLWYVFGLLGKEHAVALPLLLLGMEWALGGSQPAARRLRARAALWLVTVALTLAYVWWRSQVLGRTAQIGYWGGGPWPTFLTMLTGFRTYVRLLFFPVDLHPEYVIPIAVRVTSPGVAASFVLLVGLLGLAVALRRRESLIALGIAWFFLALAPVSNVIPLKTIVNERLLYAATIGFALTVGVAWDRASRPGWRALLVAPVGLFMVLTVLRNTEWQTSERLWSAAVATEPRGYTSHFNLGEVYRQQGKTEAALREFRLAIQLRGAFPHAHGAIGSLLVEQGDYREAVHAFRRGVEEAPDNARLRQGLVRALVAWGDTEREAGRPVVAAGAYREALRWTPRDAAARAGLAALGEDVP